MSAIRKSLSTTLRATQDIWVRRLPGGDSQLQLFPSAALHLIDHHLHASGIIPRVFQNAETIYEHDWYCVSQTVTCMPYEGLIELAVEAPEAAETHVWVTSVGNSSVHLGNLITVDDQILATARRVFVRKSRDNGQAAPFTEVERYHFEAECAADKTIQDLLHEQEQERQKRQQQQLELNGATTTTSTTSTTTTSTTTTSTTRSDKSLNVLPTLERFGTFLPRFQGKPLLTVQVGPQHVNFGAHADHAFLAETAVQALHLANLPVDSIAVNYISEAKLGQELQCIRHDDRVFVVRSTMGTPADDASLDANKKGGLRSLVLVAKGAPL